MAATYGPATQAHQLGAELRRIRVARGESGETVAAALHWSASKISRFENARTGVRVKEIERLLDYYGITGDQRKELVELAHDALGRGWWRKYGPDLHVTLQEFIGFEQGAETILIWEQSAVPVLLQTFPYAAAVVTGHAQAEPMPATLTERLVRIRMQRQRVLDSDPPARLIIVVDEAILRRPPGGDETVMAEQLERLAEPPLGVTVRVLPRTVAPGVLAGPFTVFQLPGHTSESPVEVAGVESLRQALLVKGERDAYSYHLAFLAIARTALTMDKSRALILKAADSY